MWFDPNVCFAQKQLALREKRLEIYKTFVKFCQIYKHKYQTRAHKQREKQSRAKRKQN